MPDLTLYRQNGSCSMAPHILLRELGVPFKALVVKVGPNGYEAADGSFSHADYLKIHPYGYVPALAVDGSIITENPAIIRFIADQAPGRKFLGSRPLDQYRVEEWLVWLSSSLHGSGFGAFWRPSRYSSDSSVHAAISAHGREKIVECYRMIEERIEGPFAVGHSLTVVDVYLHTFWRWGLEIGADMEQYPRYREVMRMVEALESVRGVMEEEGMPLTFQ